MWWASATLAAARNMPSVIPLYQPHSTLSHPIVHRNSCSAVNVQHLIPCGPPICGSISAMSEPRILERTSLRQIHWSGKQNGPVHSLLARHYRRSEPNDCRWEWLLWSLRTGVEFHARLPCCWWIGRARLAGLASNIGIFKVPTEFNIIQPSLWVWGWSRDQNHDWGCGTMAGTQIGTQDKDSWIW